jgi:hypothetical protein
MTFESLVIDTRLYCDISADSTVSPLFVCFGFLSWEDGCLEEKLLLLISFLSLIKESCWLILSTWECQSINDMASEIDRNKVSIIRWKQRYLESGSRHGQKKSWFWSEAKNNRTRWLIVLAIVKQVKWDLRITSSTIKGDLGLNHLSDETIRNRIKEVKSSVLDDGQLPSHLFRWKTDEHAYNGSPNINGIRLFGLIDWSPLYYRNHNRTQVWAWKKDGLTSSEVHNCHFEAR